MPDPSTTKPSRFGGLFALFAFAAGFVTVVVPVAGSSFDHLPGDLVDTRLNNYVLEHGYRYLTGQGERFWDAPFCYPAPKIIASSDAHLGNLPIYAIFRGFGAGPERAFQLWWLATFPLTFLATYWSMRRLGAGAVGAAVAAVGFTFSLSMTANVSHAQLCPRYFAPIAVLFWWRFLTAPGWKPLLGAVAAVVGQVYLTVYVAYFLGWLLLAMTLAAPLAGAQVFWRRVLLPTRRELQARLLVVGLGAVSLVPAAWPYLVPDRPAEPPSRDDLLGMLPEPGDWVRPAGSAATWADHVAADEPPAPLGAPEEFPLFPGASGFFGLVLGIGCTAALAFSAAARNEPRVRLIAVLTAAMLLVAALFLRYGEWSPYRYLVGLPVAGSVRALFRVAIVLALPAAVILGVAVDAVVRRVRSPWSASAVAVVALAGVVVDQRVEVPTDHRSARYHFSMAQAVERREALTAAIRGHPGIRHVHVFPDRPGPVQSPRVLTLQMDAMWACQTAGVPTTNGWTGHWPYHWYPFHNYVGLFYWLSTRDRLTPELLDGLLTFGEPYGYEGDPEELEWRRRFPPRPLPDVLLR